METPYSNRELDNKHREIIDKIDSFRIENEKDHQTVREALDDIKKILLLHESQISELQKWRYILTGMGIIINAILIPILFKIFL